MKYLSNETLQIFLISLYSKNKSPLSIFSPLLISEPTIERYNIMIDIIENGLEDCFYFDINEEEMSQLTNIIQLNHNDTRYDKNTFGYLIQKAINLKLNSSRLDFKDFVKPQESFPSELILTGHLYNINLYRNNKKILIEFINKYIKAFREDKLISDTNFYNYELNLKKLLEILGKYYNKYGYEFNLSGCEERDLVKISIKKELRFYEMIFYLISEKHIKVTDCNLFEMNKKRFLNIRLRLKNPIDEIKLIENSYLNYGDLSINNFNGLARYKTYEYTFRTYSRAYKVLIELIKCPEKKISIYNIYKSITEENEENKKERIAQYVKEIRRKLHIMGDRKKTINIKFIDKNFLILTKKI